MINPFSKNHVVPEQLKKLVCEIISFKFDGNGGPVYDKFIPSCTSGFIVHFKDTFEIWGIDFPVQILPKSFFTGNFNKHLQLKSIADVEGVAIILRPYGAHRIFGLDMETVSKEVFLDAKDIVTKKHYNNWLSFDTLEQKVSGITGFILEKFHEKNIPPDIVDDFCDVLLERNGNVKIKELADHFRINERYLRRRFELRIGLPAKQLAKTARISYLLKNLPVCSKPEWMGLVSSLGYTDQSHLIKDFKLVTGETPEQFFKRDRKDLNFITFLKPEV
jgi:AraC-like DNA-binding protein